MTGPGRATRRWALAVGLGVVIAIGAVQAWLGTIAPVLDGDLRFGFPAYLTSSRLAVDGRWGPEVYDNDWFHARSLEVTGGRVAEIYRPNTPMMSLLALPVAGLDVATARAIWLVVDLLLVAVAVVAVLAALPALRAPPWSLVVIALAVWWMPIRETVSLGQAYALMLALQAVGLWACLRGRWIGAGVALGVAAATKLAALPVLLLLAVRGAWRAVGTALVVGIGLAVVTLPFAGVAGWTRFVAVLVEDVVAPPASLAVPTYQSLPGLAHRLFVADAAWNPTPAVLDAPWLASVVSAAATVAVLAVTCWLGRRGRLDVAFGAAVVAGVLILNLAQEYHLAMLWLPAVIAVARVVEDPRRRGWRWVLALVAALVLLAAPWPYEDPGLSGWLLPLAYPRLIGAWLLWAWLIADLSRERSAAEREQQVGGRLDRVGAHG